MNICQLLGPKGDCQIVNTFDTAKYENFKPTATESCSCSVSNLMDILRNDTIKEILRGPQGKMGFPGLTVSYITLHYFIGIGWTDGWRQWSTRWDARGFSSRSESPDFWTSFSVLLPIGRTWTCQLDLGLNSSFAGLVVPLNTRAVPKIFECNCDFRVLDLTSSRTENCHSNIQNFQIYHRCCPRAPL